MPVINHLANYMGLSPANHDILKKSKTSTSASKQSILIADYIHKRQVLGQNEPPPDRICKTVGWLVEEFLSENSDTLASITDLLEHPPEGAKTDEEILNKIFDSMFSDGKINWGRIVSTYAFGVKYCSMQKHVDVNGNQRRSSTEKVLRSVGVYVGENLVSWINQEGGWEAIPRHFPSKEVVMKRLQSAGYLILTVGVGSLLSAFST